MEAAVYNRYGPPDVLQIKDVEKPVPKDNEVLIEVRAASVNPLDGGLLKGGGRMVTGLRKPKITRLAWIIHDSSSQKEKDALKG